MAAVLPALAGRCSRPSRVAGAGKDESPSGRFVFSTHGGEGDLKQIDDLGIEGPPVGLGLSGQPGVDVVGESESQLGGRRDLVSVVSCDAAAGGVHRVCGAEGIALVGGGGTDLRAGFDRALRMRPRPDVVVALTDGQTPWPNSRPPCRTVVGLFPRFPRSSRRAARGSWDEDGAEYVPDAPPAWARVVEIGAGAAGGRT